MVPSLPYHVDRAVGIIRIKKKRKKSDFYRCAVQTRSRIDVILILGANYLRITHSITMSEVQSMKKYSVPRARAYCKLDCFLV